MAKFASLAFLLVVFISGCSGVLNPYSSKLKCPDPDFGVCTDIETAWQASFKDRQQLKQEARIRAAKQNNKCPDGNCYKFHNSTSAAEKNFKDLNLYFTSWLKETTKLLEQSQTPVIKPPKVLYGIIFPYDSAHGDVLFLSQRVFIIAEPPRFVLSPPWKFFKKKSRSSYVIPSISKKESKSIQKSSPKTEHKESLWSNDSPWR